MGPVKNSNSNERGGIDFLLFFQIKEGMNFRENGRRESTCVLCTTKRTLWVELLLESARPCFVF